MLSWRLFQSFRQCFLKDITHQHKKCWVLSICEEDCKEWAGMFDLISCHGSPKCLWWACSIYQHAWTIRIALKVKPSYLHLNQVSELDHRLCSLWKLNWTSPCARRIGFQEQVSDDLMYAETQLLQISPQTLSATAVPLCGHMWQCMRKPGILSFKIFFFKEN